MDVMVNSRKYAEVEPKISYGIPVLLRASWSRMADVECVIEVLSILASVTVLSGVGESVRRRSRTGSEISTIPSS